MSKVLKNISVDVEFELTESDIVVAIQSSGILDRVRIIRRLLDGCDSPELSDLISFVGHDASKDLHDSVRGFLDRWDSATTSIFEQSLDTDARVSAKA